MFQALVFLATLLSAAYVAASHTTRATGGYVQNPSGSASFTMYTGCGAPGAFGITSSSFHSYRIIACGRSATGFTAALSQLSFGAAPGEGAGDACGRCFTLTGTADPFSPSFKGPFHSIVVKVTDLCPVQGNAEWCGQTESDLTNEHGERVQYVTTLIALLQKLAFMVTIALTFAETQGALPRSSLRVSRVFLPNEPR